MVSVRTMLQHHVVKVLLEHLMVFLASNAREILLLIQTVSDVSHASKVINHLGIELPVSCQLQLRLLVMKEKEKMVMLVCYVTIMREPKVMDQPVALTHATLIQFFKLTVHVFHVLVVIYQVQTDDRVCNRLYVTTENH